MNRLNEVKKAMEAAKQKQALAPKKGGSVSSALRFALIFIALFMMMVGHEEGKKVQNSQNWEPRQVKILQSELKVRSSGIGTNRRVGNYLYVQLEDQKTGTTSDNVRVNFGKMAYNVGAVDDPLASSHYDEMKRYPAGSVVTAFVSPDGKEYLLEKTDPSPMKNLFYGGIALLGLSLFWGLVATIRKKSAPSHI